MRPSILFATGAACALAAVSAHAQPRDFSLNTYGWVGAYDLPEPTRTPVAGHSLLAQEVSAITYNWDSDTLFVAGDGGTAIVQISKTGQLIDAMTLPLGGSPQGTHYYDIEGLAYVGNGMFVMVEERYRQVNLFRYLPGSTLDPDTVQTVKLGTTVDNIGLEGITFDPITNTYILLKEKDPQGIFQTSIQFAAGVASNGGPTTQNPIDMFDPATLGLLDLSDVYALSNIVALRSSPLANHLLVLSQESAKVLQIDRAGHIHGQLTIVNPDPAITLNAVNQGFEGVAVDAAGFLYLVAEAAGGTANRPQLWVYQAGVAAPTTAQGAMPVPTAPAVTMSSAMVRITEWMYNGDEFVEFTNLGTTPVDFTGWSFDDDSRVPGGFILSSIGVLAPGASAVMTEVSCEAFRTNWSLPAGVPCAGGNAANLGRADEINLFDAAGALVDRLTYGDDRIPGTIRTLDVSGRPSSAAALGANDVRLWQLSTVGDVEGSVRSTAGFVASPGRTSF